MPNLNSVQLISLTSSNLPLKVEICLFSTCPCQLSDKDKIARALNPCNENEITLKFHQETILLLLDASNSRVEKKSDLRFFSKTNSNFERSLI